MKHAAPVRRELGVPSIMNLLGPLANPAGVRRQVVGVADRERGPLMANALARLGTEHALVVHGDVGMDEISPTGATDVWEVRGGGGGVTSWRLDPARYGLAIEDVTALRGGEPGVNAERVEGVLRNGAGDAAGTGAVLLNAAAAIYVAGLARTYDDGIARAREALGSGSARRALERLRAASTSG